MDVWKERQWMWMYVYVYVYAMGRYLRAASVIIEMGTCQQSPPFSTLKSHPH